MSKQQNNQRKQPTGKAMQPNKQVGAGDKKLEGPNAPAT